LHICENPQTSATLHSTAFVTTTANFARGQQIKPERTETKDQNNQYGDSSQEGREIPKELSSSNVEEQRGCK
jgi:hypothetical protein